LRFVSTARGTAPVDSGSLGENRLLARAAHELHRALEDAERLLDPLGLGPALADATAAFYGITKPTELVEALLLRHERVQENKGKRPWFEQTTRGFVVRPLYRNGTSREISGSYVHPYRINAIRSFLSDLQ
jgi:hypothetical protein